MFLPHKGEPCSITCLTIETPGLLDCQGIDFKFAYTNPEKDIAVSKHVDTWKMMEMSATKVWAGCGYRMSSLDLG